MNQMDYNDTHAGEFYYHNITRNQISVDKYNGRSNQVEIPEKISGQEVIEIGEGAFSDNLILEHVQLPDSATCRRFRKLEIGEWSFSDNLNEVHLGKEAATVF